MNAPYSQGRFALASSLIACRHGAWDAARGHGRRNLFAQTTRTVARRLRLPMNRALRQLAQDRRRAGAGTPILWCSPCLWVQWRGAAEIGPH